jgi:hypothetical protein
VKNVIGKNPPKSKRINNNMNKNSIIQNDNYGIIGWKFRLELFNRQIEYDPFPSAEYYGGSIWWIWEEGIKDLHKKEAEKISSQFQNFQDYTTIPKGLIEEWAGEESHDINKISEFMCAGLIVAVWSKMESFLTIIVTILLEAKQINEKTENKSYKFGKVKGKLTEYGIDVQDCLKYNEINSIRILNNSFKHNEGYYQPDDDKPYNHIKPDILNGWNILKYPGTDIGDINFNGLPIKEIILNCNCFCMDLLKRVGTSLK